ncbi:MAG: immunoglobulin domain-containing protein [Pyrinomonadaceae bacterium]
MQIGPEGALYYLARGAGGTIGKIEYTANDFPQIVAQPSNQTVIAGQRATFSVSASGAQPLRYQWQKNNVNISGATASSLHHAAGHRCRQRRAL